MPPTQMNCMGIRVQYSFFNVEMSGEMMNELINRLLLLIDPKEDKIYVYPICNDCYRKIIVDGTGKLMDLNNFLIL